MKVKLTYFKPSGKYYSEAEYETGVPDEVLATGQTAPRLFKIWEEIGKMQQDKKLPGLYAGHSCYTVLVDVPGHPHEHPHIIPGYNESDLDDYRKANP